MKTTKLLLTVATISCAAALVACGGEQQKAAEPAVAASVVKTEATAADAHKAMMASMHNKGQAKMERITQDALQSACSNAMDQASDAEALRKAAETGVVFPADGNFIGDWREGESIAANGKGMQYSDNPEDPNGGNCYACHQLSPKELAYGNMGPSLQGYGARGQSEMVMKYTWSKIYNPHVYNVCSHMPRFGANHILTEQQMKDVMAYLLDPASPVNQ